ncbi:nitrite reductase small subunit NirD [Streptomyces sp. NPDC050560]|uniref:nitrite reductase small subunit NirD n=1 Tax=Streptomyces sp. NPDC050560 TaxID=3365630 RepID=UPI00378F2397
MTDTAPAAPAPAPALPEPPAPGRPVRLTVLLRLDAGWHPVCEGAGLLPGRGVAALLPGGEQAALFLDRRGRLYAIDNRDPFTGAAVLSRGLTGSADGVPYVASPLLKQRFALTTGRCLDEDGVSVRVYETRTLAE